MANHYKINGLEVANGNSKLGTDTLILNMGSGTRCPSATRGLCKVGRKCYALKAERVYKGVLPCRDRQESYWLNSSAGQIKADFDALFARFKVLKRVRFLRFNESGDFHGQACVDKLAEVAAHLKAVYGILTYGYSARSDLDFSRVGFWVKGSGHSKGNHGITIARRMDKHERESAKRGRLTWRENGVEFVACPGSCKTCNLCKTSMRHNIVFPMH